MPTLPTDCLYVILLGALGLQPIPQRKIAPNYRDNLPNTTTLLLLSLGSYSHSKLQIHLDVLCTWDVKERPTMSSRPLFGATLTHKFTKKIIFQVLDLGFE